MSGFNVGLALSLGSLLFSLLTKVFSAFISPGLLLPDWLPWTLHRLAPALSLLATTAFWQAYRTSKPGTARPGYVLVGAIVLSLFLLLSQGIWLILLSPHSPDARTIQSPAGKHVIEVSTSAIMFAGCMTMTSHTTRSGPFLREQILVLPMLDDSHPISIRWSPNEERFAVFYCEEVPTRIVFLHSGYDFAQGKALLGAGAVSPGSNHATSARDWEQWQTTFAAPGLAEAPLFPTPTAGTP